MGHERRRHERAPVAGTPLAGFDVEPRWQPTGGLITFIRIRKCCNGIQQEAIYVVNADGSGVVDITNTPGVLENFPSWGTASLEETHYEQRNGRSYGMYSGFRAKTPPAHLDLDDQTSYTWRESDVVNISAHQ